MPDPRFFEDLGPVTLSELAELTGAGLADPATGGRLVRAVSVMAGAGADTITFVSDHRFLAQARETKAGACFVGAGDVEALPKGGAAMVTAAPHAAYAIAAHRLHRPRLATGVAVSPNARIEPEVVLGPGVVIGAGAQ